MLNNSMFTRRYFVTTGLAVTSAVSLQRAAQALGLNSDAPVCRLTPEQEIGPYYIADELLRSDIVEGKPGVPLSLRMALLDARTCRPLANAAVDIWHCDALRLYETKSNGTRWSAARLRSTPRLRSATSGEPSWATRGENRTAAGKPSHGPPHIFARYTGCEQRRNGRVPRHLPWSLHGPYQPHSL